METVFLPLGGSMGELRTATYGNPAILKEVNVFNRTLSDHPLDIDLDLGADQVLPYLWPRRARGTPAKGRPPVYSSHMVIPNAYLKQ